MKLLKKHFEPNKHLIYREMDIYDKIINQDKNKMYYKIRWSMWFLEEYRNQIQIKDEIN